MTARRPGDVGVLAPAWAGTAAADLADDTAVVQAMLDTERAWLTVCRDAGLVPPAPSGSPRDCDGECADHDAFDVSSYDLTDLAARTPAGGNALIPLLRDLRAALAAANDEPGSVGVHLGATSQDVVDTALMLVAARVVDDALPHLDAACDSLADLARRHRATPTIARSLAQHALPTTFGARAASWLDQLGRATDELRRVRAELGLQWGGAAGTSAALVDACGDPERARSLTSTLATTLDLADVPAWHVDRSPVTRLGRALADVVCAAGRFGTDVVTGSRREIGELTEPAAPGRGGSSAMPHKRNPVLSVLLRSAATAAPGHLSTLYVAAGAAVDERPDGPWHAEWSALRELLRLTGGVASLVAELATGLEVHPDALRRNLDLSLPDVAPHLVGADDADVVTATGLAPLLADEAVARHRRRRAGNSARDDDTGPRPARS